MFRLGSTKIRSRRGSTTTDYLLMIAVIAGVGFPVVMNFFGGPIQDSLLGQRQNLVSFLAQDRKQNVPSSWFSQEEMGGSDPGQIQETKNFENPDVVEPGQIKDAKRFKNPNIKQPGRLTANNAANPSKLNEPGQVSVGGGGGGGGGDLGGQGGNMSPDFFGGGGGESGTTAKAGETSSGAAYGKGGGGGGEESGGSGGNVTGADKVTGGQQTNDPGTKTNTPGETRKQMLESMANAEDKAKGKQGAFDWWLLIKFLVFLLIVFLILLIVLGNMRRR